MNQQSSKCKWQSWGTKTSPQRQTLGKEIQAAPSQGCGLHSSSAAGADLAAGELVGCSSLGLKSFLGHVVAGRNVLMSQLRDSPSLSTSAACSEDPCAVHSCIKSHDLMPLSCEGAAHHSPLWHLSQQIAFLMEKLSKGLTLHSQAHPLGPTALRKHRLNLLPQEAAAGVPFWCWAPYPLSCCARADAWDRCRRTNTSASGVG